MRTPQQIRDLADEMAAKSDGFRVSRETGALVVEALRLYAREVPRTSQ